MPDYQLTHQQHQPAPVSGALSLLAHDLHSPENIGSLFRLADAFAVNHLYLSGCSPHPPNKKIRKVSRHTDKFVPYSYHAELDTLLDKLKQQNFFLLCLEQTRSSTELTSLQDVFTKPLCLIVGTEKQGVCQKLINAADACTHIPMHGHNSSMNVATATAIALYALRDSEPARS